ncbi:MAG: glutamate--tRNA ligase, partial [Alphaproteobacteria bacterium]
HRLADTRGWWDIVTGSISADIDADDVEFLRTAARLLPEGEPDHDTWKAWTGAIRDETGRKGKPLFMPLRLALTGLSSGPELAQLLPLIGRPRTLARLSAHGPAEN